MGKAPQNSILALTVFLHTLMIYTSLFSVIQDITACSIDLSNDKEKARTFFQWKNGI